MRLDDIGLTSADGDILPSVVYHGTSLSNAKRILKQGLDPARTKDRGQDTTGYVFLSWTKDGAAKFAPGGAYNVSDEPGVILAVHLDRNLAGKLKTNLGEFIRCPVTIPPDKISVV